MAEVQRLLLAGQHEDACRVAMHAGLWGHALLLSSHINAQLCNEVIAAFAERSFVPGDPVQTLYYLYGGSGEKIFQPSASNNRGDNILERFVARSTLRQTHTY